jgi:hypothetical protein
MGTVLPFSTARSPAEARRPRSGSDRPCMIVIFPGVRIERPTRDIERPRLPPTDPDLGSSRRRPRKTS